MKMQASLKLIILSAITALGAIFYFSYQKKSSDQFSSNSNHSENKLFVKNNTKSSSFKVNENAATKSPELVQLEKQFNDFKNKKFNDPESLFTDLEKLNLQIAHSPVSALEKNKITAQLSQEVTQALRPFNLPRIVSAHFDQDRQLVEPVYE